LQPIHPTTEVRWLSWETIVNFKEHIDTIHDTITFFIKYDKKSPRYWGTLDKCREYKTYNISIDLEDLMPEESEGKDIHPDCFIPDNYALAEKVEKAFKKSGGDMKSECGEHFRECASWEFKNKSEAKKLVKFIDDNYIKSTLKEKKDFFNIRRVIFGENKIDFEYKK